MKKNTMLRMLTTTLSLAMTMGLAACSGQTATAGGETDNSQAQEQTYKVGILKYMDHASLDQIQENVCKELDARSEELGITFDYADYTFSGQGDGSTLQQMAAQLVADEVDVIVPIATPAAQVVQAAIADTDIPMVFAAVSDPVTAKLVADMDAPGGNITGVSDALNTEVIMDLMFAADPDIQSVGLLYSKSEDSSTKSIAEAKAYLEEKNIPYEERTGTNTDEISSAADALIAAGVDAIFTPTDNTVMKAELAIFEKLQDAGIPHYAGADSFALNGAFFGYGVDYSQLGTETADMVVDILVNGADPAEMAVKVLAHETATINTQVCEAIGFDMEALEDAFGALGFGIAEITTAQSFGDVQG